MDIMNFNSKFSSEWKELIDFDGIFIILFIDNTVACQSEDLRIRLRELVPDEIKNHIIIIQSPNHIDAIYGRTVIFNYTFNRFKRNFVMGFSDDDDLHCNLEILRNYIMEKNIINDNIIHSCVVASIPNFIPNPTSFLNDVSSTLSHTGLWRHLFPWKVFYRAPMTLDCFPKIREDMRFWIRALKMGLCNSR